MDIIEYINAGLSFIPTTQDKLPHFKLLPNGKWDYYQKYLPSIDDVMLWSQQAKNFAVVCGEVSGNLEVIDIDNHKGNASSIYYEYQNIILTHCPDIWKKLYVETSRSGGYHLIYRHTNYKHSKKPEGSKKLAMQWIGNKKDTLIETKGEGGYVVVYPTPGYEPLQGSLTALNTLTDDERHFLLKIARSFNEIPE